MKYKRIFCTCKDLVLKYGYTRDGTYCSQSSYVDRYNIGFQIIYNVTIANEGDDQNEILSIYLGGRLLYFSSKSREALYCNDDSLDDLMRELSYVEAKTILEEPICINESMFDYYRKESDSNRVRLRDYARECLAIIEKRGSIKRVSFGSRLYEFVGVDSMDHVLKINVTDSSINSDIEMSYDNEIVFCYRWGQINNVCIDHTGMFTQGVEWIKSLSEFNFKLSPDFLRPLD